MKSSWFLSLTIQTSTSSLFELVPANSIEHFFHPFVFPISSIGNSGIMSEPQSSTNFWDGLAHLFVVEGVGGCGQFILRFTTSHSWISLDKRLPERTSQFYSHNSNLIDTSSRHKIHSKSSWILWSQLVS